MSVAPASGFLRITCSKCGGYLGDIYVSHPTTSRHHCKTCNRNIQHEVDPAGLVVRSYPYGKLHYIDSISVVEA